MYRYLFYLSIAVTFSGCVAIGDNVLVIRGEMGAELSSRAKCTAHLIGGLRTSYPATLSGEFELDFTVGKQGSTYGFRVSCVSDFGEVTVNKPYSLIRITGEPVQFFNIGVITASPPLSQ